MKLAILALSLLAFACNQSHATPTPQALPAVVAAAPAPAVAAPVAPGAPAQPAAAAEPAADPNAPSASLALATAQNALEGMQLKLQADAEQAMLPARIARTKAAGLLAKEQKLAAECFLPDLKTQDQAQKCGERIWWYEGGQIKRPPKQEAAAAGPAQPPGKVAAKGKAGAK